MTPEENTKSEDSIRSEVGEIGNRVRYIQRRVGEIGEQVEENYQLLREIQDTATFENEASCYDLFDDERVYE
jgi:hypothetical protein